MRTKIYFISALLVLATLLSACVPSGSTQSQATTNPRLLNVNGSAQVTLPPDIAYITIGVHTENANASEAVAANNALAQAVMDAIKAQGVDAKDIRTTSFNVYPQQNWGPEGQKLDTIYMVDNSVYVTLRDLNKIGEVLGAAVGAGANNINSIQFDAADKTAALTEARKMAVENASKMAQELSQAAGVELGKIYSINFYNSYPVTRDMKTVQAEGVGGGYNVPVSAGDIVINVEVNLSYELR